MSSSGQGGSGGAASSSSSGQGGSGGQALVEDCTNGTDDDGDSAIDCADTDCAATCANTCGVTTTVSDNSTTKGSTVGYGDATDGSCAMGGAEHVYSVTASVTGTMKIDLVTFDDFVLSARTSCADAASELQCANALAVGGTETLTFNVTAGQTLAIVVESAQANATGDFQLQIATSVCAGAPLADPGMVMGTTVGAPSAEDPVPNSGCFLGMPSPEQVFAFTAAQTGVLDVSLDPQYDAVLYVRDSCGASPNEKCNDVVAPAKEKVSLAVTKGQTYYIVVDGFGGQSGTFTLTAATRVPVCGDGLAAPSRSPRSSRTTPPRPRIPTRRRSSA